MIRLTSVLASWLQIPCPLWPVQFSFTTCNLYIHLPPLFYNKKYNFTFSNRPISEEIRQIRLSWRLDKIPNSSQQITHVSSCNNIVCADLNGCDCSRRGESNV
ncbi:hypothetical protein EDB19DRAFT_231331 [Suillus lakei]|nr:hypothetical protein EDB19DRAFT_231331 [Suillus lakei]